YIKMVRVGYFGEWFVLAGGAQRCFGCPAGDVWANSTLSPPAEDALKEIAARYQTNPYAGDPIRDVAFLSNGGYLILYEKNSYYGAGVPETALRVIDMLRSANRERKQVKFG